MTESALEIKMPLVMYLSEACKNTLAKKQEIQQQLQTVLVKFDQGYEDFLKLSLKVSFSVSKLLKNIFTWVYLTYIELHA